MKPIFQFFFLVYLICLLGSTAGQSLILLLFLMMTGLGVAFKAVSKGPGLAFESLRTHYGLALIVFCAWAILTSVFFVPDPEPVALVLNNMKWALAYWVIFFLVIQYSVPAPKIIFRSLAVMVIFVGLYGLIQMFYRIDLVRPTVDHMSAYGSFYRAVGFYKVPLTYAYTLGMVGIFAGAAIMLKNHLVPKWLTWAAFISTIIGLIASNTRGAWIAFLAAYFTGALLKDRKILVRTAITTLIALSVLSLHPDFRSRVMGSFQSGSNKERTDLWQANFAMFKDHPFTGIGWERSRDYLPQYYEIQGIHSTFYNHAHNDYVAMLSELGILGLALFLWLGFTFLRLSYRLYRDSSNENLKLLGLGGLMAQILFYVGSLTQANFQDVEVRYILVLIWSALALAASKRSYSQSPSQTS